MKEKIKVKIEYGGSGKHWYVHIVNGEKRVELLNECKVGNITVVEMQNLARKHPYILKASKVENNPDKYEILTPDAGGAHE